jgi:large subunit ribosomal protein L2
MGETRRQPVTPGTRSTYLGDFSEITAARPEKRLTKAKNRINGRNAYGRITLRRRGGGHKKRYRVIDFRRNKLSVPGKVVSVEYDPNRTARIALIHYADGEKRYILCPGGLKVGMTVVAGPGADVKVGHVMPMADIPVGELLHNIELRPNGGGRLVRGAGTSAQLMAKADGYALLRMPSGEQRKVLLACSATIGVVSNSDHANRVLGKAGRVRWMGRRPKVRGVAMNPVDHPHGGGEGKTSGGRHPVSPWGLKTKGKKTRLNKRTDKFIVRRRRA